MGSFGMAWIARTTDVHPEGSGRLCVLKFAHPFREEEGEEQLANEYAIMSIVNHPNVVRMIEYQPYEDPYLALEFANAGCLGHFANQLQEGTCLNDEKWSRFYFKQVMEGLKAIHESNFAHLDIKVDNIFVNVSLTDEEIIKNKSIVQVKIGDFGMAKEKHKQIKEHYGKHYRAPENLAHPEKAYDGEKADVFAAAHVLITLFTKIRFSNDEQADSQFYKDFIENKNLSTFWEYACCTPS